MIAAEETYSINYAESRKTFLSLYNNEAASYLFVNGVGIQKLKAKDPEINAIPLWLGNISNNFSVDHAKKTGFNGYVYNFSVDYDAIAVDDILNIHNYLMKNHDK